uniref:ethanolamine-phosphate cytidylyltransferase n=1 Tax=Ditylenchus dipsaci TaxID=166011 RepID=A0A915DYL8_9BILA
MSEKKLRKEVRVWCDGCYDMVHFGHANQLRQAKQMGTYLVVGVHNDEEITNTKWVDEIVEDAPYSTTVQTLDKYKCDFVCMEVNDITLTADGQDTYADVKRLGRYRECDRTPGVSTTDLSEHHERARTLSTDHEAQSPWTRISRFIPSTSTIMQFAEGRQPAPNDKIVYVICGSFDLFHIGHLCFLEEAKKLGDYLIVGIYSDQVVNEYRGQNYPIMTLHERVLSVLSFKPVSEVVIGAPYSVTQELVDRFRIDVVVQGCHTDHHSTIDDVDCYELAKELGIYRTVDSGNDMTTEKIIERIIDHKREFETRNRNKAKKEIASYKALQKLKQKLELQMVY